MPVLEHADENLLDQIFVQRLTSTQAYEEVVQPFVMPFEQMSQICDLALTDPQHQLVISRRIHAVSARFSSIVYCQSVRR